MSDEEHKPMYEVLDNGVVNVTDVERFQANLEVLHQEAMIRDAEAEEDMKQLMSNLQKIADGDEPMKLENLFKGL